MNKTIEGNDIFFLIGSTRYPHHKVAATAMYMLELDNLGNLFVILEIIHLWKKGILIVVLGMEFRLCKKSNRSFMYNSKKSKSSK